MSTIPNEHGEQSAVIEWSATRQAALPELELLYAVPNGGLRHKAVAGRLKAEGVKSGVPDLCLPVARGGYHSLYIEMKTLAGSASEKQRQWIARLQREGHRAEVCYGAAEAIALIETYLGVPEHDRTQIS
mgnify:CR=1 FL=1